MDGHESVISGLSLDYSSSVDSYLRFVNIDFYSTSIDLLTIDYAENVVIENCTIHADRWSASIDSMKTSLNIQYSKNITVKDTEIYEVGRGIQIRGSQNVDIDHNYIRVKGGTAIQYLSNNEDVVIQNNHITGEEYTPYPDDPLAMDDPHQSIVSIRSDNITIRNNVMHGLGTSSGIMFYEPDAAGGEDAYSNITIENNIIYDIDNNYCIRMYNLGDNVNIRNNLLFSRKRDGSCSGSTNDARYRYETALTVHNIAQGYDGSGLNIYNNIFIGTAYIPATTNEKTNIYWSLSIGGSWQSASPSGESTVLVDSYKGCGNHPLLFEDGSFFAEANELWFAEKEILTFLLHETSIGLNYGNVANQYSKSIGEIGSDGFLKDNGVVRSSTIHSAGPIETYYLADAVTLGDTTLSIPQNLKIIE